MAAAGRVAHQRDARTYDRVGHHRIARRHQAPLRVHRVADGRAHRLGQRREVRAAARQDVAAVEVTGHVEHHARAVARDLVGQGGSRAANDDAPEAGLRQAVRRQHEAEHRRDATPPRGDAREAANGGGGAVRADEQPRR